AARAVAATAGRVAARLDGVVARSRAELRRVDPDVGIAVGAGSRHPRDGRRAERPFPIGAVPRSTAGLARRRTLTVRRGTRHFAHRARARAVAASRRICYLKTACSRLGGLASMKCGCTAQMSLPTTAAVVARPTSVATAARDAVAQSSPLVRATARGASPLLLIT